VDGGAIKPLMKGAPLMCPGLTSDGNFPYIIITNQGGKMCEKGKNEVVLIMANGKKQALGVGKTLMTTTEI